MGGNLSIKLNNQIYSADKIDLKRHKRNQIRSRLNRLFSFINTSHYEVTNELIWKWINLGSKEVYNGSSRNLFDDDITDEEFIKYKPTLGDIDISVPVEAKDSFFNFLKPLTGSTLYSDVLFVGMNRESVGNNHQFNCLFRFEELDLNVQVDFEFVEYSDGKQTEFSVFSHSSSWSDTVKGFKSGLKSGVAHKYLLKNLTRAVSFRDDIVLCTDKSPIPKDETELHVLKISKKPIFSFLAFSVDRGLRNKVDPVLYSDGSPVMIGDKQVFKERPTKDSNYFKDLDIISYLLLDDPDLKEYLYSFYSLLDVMSWMDPEVSKHCLRTMIEIDLFGKASQKLSRESAEEDLKIKQAILEEYVEKFPYLKEILNEYEELKATYYQRY